MHGTWARDTLLSIDCHRRSGATKVFLTVIMHVTEQLRLFFPAQRCMALELMGAFTAELCVSEHCDGCEVYGCFYSGAVR